jgi:hypothetical protein
VSGLRIHTVFDNPSDFPGHIVVRVFAAQPDGTVLCDREALKWSYQGVDRVVALRLARRYCKRLGLVRLDRHPSDDPVIVETWV